MKKIFLVCAVAVSAIVMSCSSSKEIENIPVEERFKQALESYEKENYLEALDAFKLIIVQFQGSKYAEESQFYLAECRFKRGEYILAAAEYDYLVRVAVSSPYASIARYKKGLSYYNLSPKSQLDQKYSRLALDEFQSYVEFFPADTLAKDAESKIAEVSDKIAKKVFQGGILYYRLEYFRAAIVYFETVVEQYHDSQYCDDALFWKAKCQYERKDFSSAINTLAQLEEKFPAFEEKKEIEKLKKDIQFDMTHPDPTFWEKIQRWL